MIKKIVFYSITFFGLFGSIDVPAQGNSFKGKSIGININRQSDVIKRKPPHDRRITENSLYVAASLFFGYSPYKWQGPVQINFPYQQISSGTVLDKTFHGNLIQNHNASFLNNAGIKIEIGKKEGFFGAAVLNWNGSSLLRHLGGSVGGSLGYNFPITEDNLIILQVALDCYHDLIYFEEGWVTVSNDTIQSVCGNNIGSQTTVNTRIRQSGWLLSPRLSIWLNNQNKISMLNLLARVNIGYNTNMYSGNRVFINYDYTTTSDPYTGTSYAAKNGIAKNATDPAFNFTGNLNPADRIINMNGFYVNIEIGIVLFTSQYD